MKEGETLKMAARDERLDPVRSFTVSSLRVEQERWRLLEEEQQVVLSSFFNTPDYTELFVCRAACGGLSVSLDFPLNVYSKVVCVSKTGSEVITKENVRHILTIQEVQGRNTKSFIMAACEEVTGPSLSNPETSKSVAEAAVKFIERQRYEALLLKAHVEGRTCLAYPDGLHADAGGRKLSDMKLLHACDSTIMEWAGLVSEFLQQDSSQPVLDGLEPLPSEEFNFWETRRKNLLFLQQQLKSSRAQQVLSIVQKAESVYWSTLRDIYRDVQEGLEEAEDVTLNLIPVQEKLEGLKQMEYQQLGDNMVFVMEEMRLLWIRSEVYCKPSRIVILLQEICNLFIQMSRTFLQEQALLRGLVSDPAVGLNNVRLVISTLQSLKDAYSQSRTQLQEQDGHTRGCWDFPSHLVFYSLDNFLLHLQSIQEVFSVSLQLHLLDSRPLSGVGGRKWSAVVQEVFQDFLRHVTVLSDCRCDATDPGDQSLQLHLDQFWVQVLDLERRLVSVLSRAFEACCASSSAAKLVQMFGFILDRPLIQDQLRPHLIQLEALVLEELDQIELQFNSQRENPQALNRFSPAAAARLCWTQQLLLRAEDTGDHYTTIQQPYLASSQLVPQRLQQVVEVLQDFREQLRTGWTFLLDSDCEFILKQPLIHSLEQGMLGVNCSHEVVLRAFRCVSRDPGLELRPLAAGLFSLRDDLTHNLLSLVNMVSCYQQVVSDVLPVEQPLIHQQLLHLNNELSHLQTRTWSSTGVQQLLQQKRERLLLLHSTVTQARANMAAVTLITQVSVLLPYYWSSR
ncbi:dynein axonemal heavy chain 17-like isoform X2 [Clinocottus analis]|uniref:dynein axonemal heavy chain 17-like isoform X2 n=1 Tax=Clinocottus analis TaxID=304258 RepID=UPI0035BF1BD9